MNSWPNLFFLLALPVSSNILQMILPLKGNASTSIKISLYIYKCKYYCTCIYIYKEKEREREREREMYMCVYVCLCGNVSLNACMYGTLKEVLQKHQRMFEVVVYFSYVQYNIQMPTEHYENQLPRTYPMMKYDYFYNWHVLQSL